MAKIEIYIKPTCPFCMRALALLKTKAAAPKILDITDDASLRPQMIERSQGRTTVPQIFINGQHIGGSDDLAALDARGGLDPLLAISG